MSPHPIHKCHPTPFTNVTPTPFTNVTFVHKCHPAPFTNVSQPRSQMSPRPVHKCHLCSQMSPHFFMSYPMVLIKMNFALFSFGLRKVSFILRSLCVWLCADEGSEERQLGTQSWSLRYRCIGHSKLLECLTVSMIHSPESTKIFNTDLCNLIIRVIVCVKTYFLMWKCIIGSQ